MGQAETFLNLIFCLILPLWIQYLLNTSFANSAFHCKSKRVHNQDFVSARTGGRISPPWPGLGSLSTHLDTSAPLRRTQHSHRPCSGSGKWTQIPLNHQFQDVFKCIPMMKRIPGKALQCLNVSKARFSWALLPTNDLSLTITIPRENPPMKEEAGAIKCFILLSLPAEILWKWWWVKHSSVLEKGSMDVSHPSTAVFIPALPAQISLDPSDPFWWSM